MRLDLQQLSYYNHYRIKLIVTPEGYMAYGKTWFVFLVTLFLSSALVSGDLLNGGFEIKDPNNSLGFSPPANWDIEDYAAVHSSFSPEPEHGQGSHPDWVGWTIPEAYSGENFLLLSTGDIGPDSSTKQGKASQLIDFEPGQKLYVSYFFGTCDYPEFFDNATIWVVADPNYPAVDPNFPSRGQRIFYIDVSEVGQYDSTDGWQLFEYEIKKPIIGPLRLVFKVEDYSDTIYKSYFAIDHVVLCDNAAPGDVTRDCLANYDDFAIIADNWSKDCNDPNVLCNEYVDFDHNGIIDVGDVGFFLESWMDGH